MGDMFSNVSEKAHTFVSRIACSSSLTHLVADASDRGDSSANAVRMAVDTSGCLGLEGWRWSGKGNASAISSAEVVVVRCQVAHAVAYFEFGLNIAADGELVLLRCQSVH